MSQQQQQGMRTICVLSCSNVNIGIDRMLLLLLKPARAVQTIDGGVFWPGLSQPTRSVLFFFCSVLFCLSFLLLFCFVFLFSLFCFRFLATAACC
jgi:hypothetical protein